MRTILSVFQSKIGFTIFLLVAAMFVAMGFSNLQQNKMYVVLADSIQFSINQTELSTYTVTLRNLEPQALQLPPSNDGMPLLIPTKNFIHKYSKISPTKCNMFITYRTSDNEEHGIDVFEAYTPQYDAEMGTLQFSAKIFEDRNIPTVPQRVVSLFIALK